MTVTLVTSTGEPICEHCLVADDILSRMRGLLGRDDLPAGEGVWIRPTSSIHMFFMRFAIDAVFLDREQTVVKIVERLRPWRMAGARHARSVVELPAGECARRGLRVGDRVLVGEDVAVDGR